jgi:hypothetical protein
MTQPWNLADMLSDLNFVELGLWMRLSTILH